MTDTERTNARKKQINALSRAHHWHGPLGTVRDAIKEASSWWPISEHQWHHLRIKFGEKIVKELRQVAAEVRS
jgi:hypothetical protein